VDVDVWGPQGETCSQYLQKGRPVLVEGRLKLDTWTDNDGNRRSKHFIVADRVTFLAAQQAQQDENFDFGAKAKPEAEKKQEVKEEVKEETAPAEEPKSEPASPTGEVNFKDQAPFEDDLPF